MNLAARTQASDAVARKLEELEEEQRKMEKKAQIAPLPLPDSTDRV